MPNAPKKVNRPWIKQRTPFERDRTKEFDYNGRKWRSLRERFFSDPANQLCKHCEAHGRVTAATVADHEPQAKVLVSQGKDPYDMQYLQPLCKQCHNAKSGREGHKR